ncbi:hypothetical protein [Rhodopseudomonas telluris]|uniref:Glycosyltransferase RgtA/B/C/D-like domain-containing protein n=1 Tax=Rhodopseudomonas telluris TaxID=644215 RepID=A0ABV6EPM0_9BRAD
MKRLLLIGLFALIFHVVAMGVYLRNGLQGNIDFHILSSSHFGVPKPLADRGLRPLYEDGVYLGWDGQFYYYIANDLRGSPETMKHIDTPGYRYQRIGLPLLAKAASIVTFQGWVSPTLYYLTYLLLLVAGTMAAGLLLQSVGCHPAWSLLWTLSAGTQLTLLNGLPDAAADAFFLIGLACLRSNRRVWVWLSVIPLSFMVLSREAYVALPVLLFLFFGLDRLRAAGTEGRLASVAAWIKSPAFICLAVPVLAFAAVQIAVRFGLNVDPGAAQGILGPPLKAWWRFWSSGISGVHPFVGAGAHARSEFVLLTIFLALLVITFVLSIRLFVVAYHRRAPLDQALGATAAVFCVLYLFFADAVMMHYSGYMKVASIFLFLVPYMNARKDELAGQGQIGGRVFAQAWQWCVREPGKKFLYAFLIVAALYGGIHVWEERILPENRPLYWPYTRVTEPRSTNAAECLPAYKARFDVLEERPFPLPDTRYNRLFPPPTTKLIRVRATNLTDRPFANTSAPGAVNLSYQWLDSAGHLISDGIRTFVPGGIAPQASAEAWLVAEYPRQPGRYILRISAVQESCSWFHTKDPSSAVDLSVEVR